MIGTGTALVEIRAIGREEDYVRQDRGKAIQEYTVQVGAFVQEENALTLKAQLEKDYRPVYIVIAERADRRYYRVRVGKLRTEEQADLLASRLSQLEKLETFVVRED
jgi:cell division septation protein DedD